MEIPGLGPVTRDDFGLLASEPVEVPMLGGAPCRILLEGYEEDAEPADFHRAIQLFLSASPEALKKAGSAVFQYYEDFNSFRTPADDEYLALSGPDEVWAHVEFGSEPVFSRDTDGDGRVYASLECSCDWEREHGLQLVFRDGHLVSKVGPFDGHLTNPGGAIYRATGAAARR